MRYKALRWLSPTSIVALTLALGRLSAGHVLAAGSVPAAVHVAPEPQASEVNEPADDVSPDGPAESTPAEDVRVEGMAAAAPVNDAALPAAPCPLPDGDKRCSQAADHLLTEFGRGHGGDAARPDLAPLLNVSDVAQGFGATSVGMEPLQMVDGQLVHFHDGVDLPADTGEPVMAAGSGVVVFADVIPTGAQTVEIVHPGGYHTLYLHQSQLLVSAGQQVVKGQIIGLVGSTGMSTGPHLHFTIQDASGKPIDPAPFIGPLPEVDNFAFEPAPPPAPVYMPIPVRPRIVAPAPMIRRPNPVVPARPAAAPARAAVAPKRR